MSDDEHQGREVRLPVNTIADLEREQPDLDDDQQAEAGPAPADLGRPASIREPVPGRGLDTEQVELLENEATDNQDRNRPGDDDALQEGQPGPSTTSPPDPTEASLPGDELDVLEDARIEEGEARPGGTDQL